MGRRSYRRLQVALGKRDRERVRALLRKGELSARVLRRAEILQMLDRGWTQGDITDALDISPMTVQRIGRRYMEEGLDSALKERTRRKKARLLTNGDEIRIIAMVCSRPPSGHARWSVRLIAEEAMKRKIVATVGRETIRVLLKTHELKPWREKNVVRG
jgi:putative transposase